MTDNFQSKLQDNLSRVDNNSGFSMLEILLAVAILTIGMMATTTLALGVINGNSVSKKVTTASVLAQDKIESIREVGYRGLPSIDTTVTENYGAIQYTIGGVTSDYPDYKRLTATQIDSPMTGMKTVTVSVYWKTGTNPVTFKTYLSE
jgi:prepilin-type N-terminal cleavage/methylation domain-containing protein